MMTREQSVMLRVIADEVREREEKAKQVASHLVSELEERLRLAIEQRLANARPIELQAASPDVVVNVDLKPLVAVMGRIEDVLGKLLKALDKRPPPAVNVELDVPPRPKRKLVVQHDDGTKSVITEE